MEAERQPGTARFGNFINYYSFNPPDKRLNILDKDVFSRVRHSCDGPVILCLDLGCNSGDLTQALYEEFAKDGAVSADGGIVKNAGTKWLGVELDPVLTARAVEANKHPDCIEFQQADIMKTDDRANTVNAYLKRYELLSFDLVCCFSMTMWIHLNHGDQGLQDFLQYISNISTFLLIEPQPWKCYRNAERRMKRSNCEPFKLFSELTWRENVDRQIEDFLVKQCDMALCDSLGQTQWGRSVSLFQKQEHS